MTATGENGAEPRAPSAPSRPRLWATRPDALAALLLAALLLATVAVIAVRNARVGGGIEVVRGPEIRYRVDLNAAGESELVLLPGIGPARAKRLVEWRAAHGPFAGLEEVRKAARMSAREVERLAPAVTFGAGPAPTEPVAPTPKE